MYFSSATRSFAARRMWKGGGRDLAAGEQFSARQDLQRPLLHLHRHLLRGNGETSLINSVISNRGE